MRQIETVSAEYNKTDSNVRIKYFSSESAAYPKTVTDRSETQENGLAYTVVKRLLTIGNYLSKGYHIFVDKFFTSVPPNLCDLGTAVTGTIRRNRKFIPKALTERFAVRVAKYFRQGLIFAVGYRKKKSQHFPVILLSSKAKAESSIHFVHVKVKAK